VVWVEIYEQNDDGWLAEQENGQRFIGKVLLMIAKTTCFYYGDVKNV